MSVGKTPIKINILAYFNVSWAGNVGMLGTRSRNAHTFYQTWSEFFQTSWCLCLIINIIARTTTSACGGRYHH